MQPPHEPEIEALGRAARGFLWLLRRAFWLAGAAAIGYGVWRSLTPDDPLTPEQGVAGAMPVPSPNALGVVWVCLGLPALLPVDWLFGRGLWLALTASAGLWFGAMMLPADHRYGCLLRIVATFVVAASLLVWRTLWRLTSAPAAQAAAGPSI